MADPNSYVGGTFSVSAAKPGTVDAAGFNALSYTLVGKIVSIGQIGDTSANISVELLEGRVFHINGILDGGEIPVTYAFDSAGDAGQTILSTYNNTNTNCSFKLVDPDGKVGYFFGTIASLQDLERAAGSYKGYSGVLRGNSKTVRP